MYLLRGMWDTQKTEHWLPCTDRENRSRSSGRWWYVCLCGQQCHAQQKQADECLGGWPGEVKDGWSQSPSTVPNILFKPMTGIQPVSTVSTSYPPFPSYHWAARLLTHLLSMFLTKTVHQKPPFVSHPSNRQSPWGLYQTLYLFLSRRVLFEASTQGHRPLCHSFLMDMFPSLPFCVTLAISESSWVTCTHHSHRAHLLALVHTLFASARCSWHELRNFFSG